MITLKAVATLVFEPLKLKLCKKQPAVNTFINLLLAAEAV